MPGFTLNGKFQVRRARQIVYNYSIRQLNSVPKGRRLFHSESGTTSCKLYAVNARQHENAGSLGSAETSCILKQFTRIN